MNRCARFACLVAVIAFSFVNPLRAQVANPDVAVREDKASDAMIATALERLNLKSSKQGATEAFSLNGRPIELRVLQRGAKLLLKTRLEKYNPPLDAINRYNEQIAVTTRAVQYQTAGVVLESGLDCSLGIDADALSRFILGFRREVKSFEQFMDAQTAAVPKVEAKTSPLKFPAILAPRSDDKELEITFPTGEPAPGETAWKIIWDMQTAESANAEGFRFPPGRKSATLLFRIKKAYFRPGKDAPWLQVLEDVHPSEFYVPYYFKNTRFFDLRDVGGYAKLTDAEGGPRSKVLGTDKRVMAEVRDRGLAYKHGGRWRRAEELVLWANFGAGNYTYFVEFCFHDDGTIALRHAPTGYNFFSHFEEAAHMHNVLWRIGMRLGVETPGQPMPTKVHLVKLPYSPKLIGPEGKLDVSEITQESFHDWDAKEFTRLRVTNPDVTLFPKDPKDPKKLQRPIAYDLVATMAGQARHYRYKDEGFSEHDFWVTRPDSPEKMFVYIHDYFRGREYQGKKSAPQPLQGSDGVVLWHHSSALHVPRGEDGIYFGTSSYNGQALATWTHVELRPRNLFTKTPIYRVK